MTRTSTARIAGLTFLVYIAAGIASMVLYNHASGGEGIGGRLANIAQHVFEIRVTIMLGLLQAVSALALAVTLYGITRDEDPDLALLAMFFRVGEGLLAAVPIRTTLEVLWLATAVGAKAPDATTAQALGTYLLDGPTANTGAIFFAIGSTLFSYLLLRGRTIPVLLAWLGVFASILLVIGLPLQFAGFLSGPVTGFMWIPMAAFEIPLGLWLLVKGVAAPTLRSVRVPNRV